MRSKSATPPLEILDISPVHFDKMRSVNETIRFSCLLHHSYRDAWLDGEGERKICIRHD